MQNCTSNVDYYSRVTYVSDGRLSMVGQVTARYTVKPWQSNLVPAYGTLTCSAPGRSCNDLLPTEEHGVSSAHGRPVAHCRTEQVDGVLNLP